MAKRQMGTLGVTTESEQAVTIAKEYKHNPKE